MAEPLLSEVAEITIAHIKIMMGIKEIIIKGDQIRITYDLLQATEKQIEKEIANSGGVLGQDWANKLRRMFIEYTEEAEVLSMEAKPNAMRCHKH